MSRAPLSPGLSRGDWLLALLIGAATLAWFAAQPRNLGVADESYMLVEASRVAAGEVLYRDIFWFAMPGAHWLLAAAFALFGTTITTAKLFIAVVNALTVVLAFAAARTLGVRAAVAVLPPLAFLAAAQPAWPYVSPHWVSTALLMALVLALAPPSALERRRRLVLAGMALGALGAVHQQKAPVLAVSVAIAILLASWMRRPPDAPGAFRRLALVAAGTLVVLAPVLGVLFATVDAQRLIDDMLRFPLTGYRELHEDISWGQVGLMNLALAAYVWPRLLRYLPAVLALGGLATALGCLRGWPRGRVVQWSTLLLLCAGSAASIGYNDDFIHVAFIAMPFFVLAALLLETGLRAVPEREQPMATVLASVALAIAFGMQSARNAKRMVDEYTLPTDTAFGRVDFQTPSEVEIAAALRRHLDQAERRDLFVYPVYTSLYLTAGGHNATRHQLLLPRFNVPAHVAEVLDALEQKAVPTVVVVNVFLLADDPVLAYLTANYDVAVQGTGWTIYRRRPVEKPMS